MQGTFLGVQPPPQPVEVVDEVQGGMLPLLVLVLLDRTQGRGSGETASTVGGQAGGEVAGGALTSRGPVFHFLLRRMAVIISCSSPSTTALADALKALAGAPTAAAGEEDDDGIIARRKAEVVSGTYAGNAHTTQQPLSHSPSYREMHPPCV